MAEVLFYHLEQARLEGVLPDLLERSLQRGWTADVRVGNEERLEEIDSHLWTYADDSFLPHGIDHEGDKQPISLSSEAYPNKGKELLFLVEAAKADLTELENYKRCVIIFNGSDEPSLGLAREQWKEISKTDHDATYWRQSQAGKWEKQA